MTLDWHGSATAFGVELGTHDIHGISDRILFVHSMVLLLFVVY